MNHGQLFNWILCFDCIIVKLGITQSCCTFYLYVVINTALNSSNFIYMQMVAKFISRMIGVQQDLNENYMLSGSRKGKRNLIIHR